MNKFKARIEAVNIVDEFSMVSVRLGTAMLKVIITSPTEKESLNDGRTVFLIFKETDISIAKKGGNLVSISNCLPAKVTAIEQGKLLCRLTTQFEDKIIKVVTTHEAIGRLNVSVGDAIELLIRANEIMLVEQ